MKKQVLLMIETSRAHGRGMLEGIAQYIREKTHWKVFFEDRGVMEKIPGWLKTWHGDGIITRSPNSAFAAELHEKNLPVVELLGDGQRFPSEIGEDFILAGKMAADHFLERGFRNFAFFCPDNTVWSKHRRDAFQQRLAENDASCEVCRFPKKEMKDYRLNAILKQSDDFLENWLRSLPKPTGLLAAIDLHAAYILEACLNANIAVPEEIAILGCGNDRLHCSLFFPQLSSIDLNSRRIGYEAAQLLDKKMNGEPLPPLPVIIPPIGVVTRQSTDIIAVHDADVAQVLKNIRERFVEPVGVQQITAEIAMSRRTLERRFQKCIGRTIENELIRVRLEHAKYLLRETNFQITAIGPHVGIVDPQYFMRFFHRETGMTPSQYRRQNQIGVPTNE
ncbi:MAG: DNA-binding transcriptional regulator [Planctomycetaceae bacterium]|nr:DNA-binding transcriptional regulator [Planctomycetaceae bacterium]